MALNMNTTNYSATAKNKTAYSGSAKPSTAFADVAKPSTRYGGNPVFDSAATLGDTGVTLGSTTVRLHGFTTEAVPNFLRDIATTNFANTVKNKTSYA